ncbi:hypothetical protein RvY_12111 [Ramazzottius varieornatus]|uniref:Uncharacterized protein n=1 Tax=Ramazzottius varieornatus TaxID=947166 RepID=A0A1D1VS54_RAMVA|nr:hypothetical protein RvY_12111 [Ramazzottius varieornatus]
MGAFMARIRTGEISPRVPRDHSRHTASGSVGQQQNQQAGKPFSDIQPGFSAPRMVNRPPTPYHDSDNRECDFFNQQQGFNQPQQRNFNQQLQQFNYQPTQQTFNQQPGNDKREPPCVRGQVVQTYNQTQGFIQQHGQGFPAPPMLPPIYNTQKQDWVDFMNIPAPRTLSPTFSDYDAARFKRDFAEVVCHWETENQWKASQVQPLKECEMTKKAEAMENTPDIKIITVGKVETSGVGKKRDDAPGTNVIELKLLERTTRQPAHTLQTGLSRKELFAKEVAELRNLDLGEALEEVFRPKKPEKNKVLTPVKLISKMSLRPRHMTNVKVAVSKENICNSECVELTP